MPKLLYRSYSHTVTIIPQHQLRDRRRPTSRILLTGPIDFWWTMWRRRRRTIQQNCQTITSCPTHTTTTAIQSTASQNYNLRHRTHSLELPAHTTHLTDCTFITRIKSSLFFSIAE